MLRPREGIAQGVLLLLKHNLKDAAHLFRFCFPVHVFQLPLEPGARGMAHHGILGRVAAVAAAAASQRSRCVRNKRLLCHIGWPASFLCLRFLSRWAIVMTQRRGTRRPKGLHEIKVLHLGKVKGPVHDVLLLGLVPGLVLAAARATRALLRARRRRLEVCFRCRLLLLLFLLGKDAPVGIACFTIVRVCLWCQGQGQGQGQGRRHGHALSPPGARPRPHCAAQAVHVLVAHGRSSWWSWWWWWWSRV